jgi:anti-sigma regulatory factor (Ser/Thr protein kinase)
VSEPSAPELAESYPPVPGSVARARRALIALAAAVGADAELIEKLGLAVSEAMTHAVLRSRRSRAPIRVTAAVAPEELAVQVADEGADVGPRELVQAARGLSPGLGLALIAQSADALVVARRPTGGTELTMRFALGRLSPRS